MQTRLIRPISSTNQNNDREKLVEIQGFEAC